jgi:hypothetical protein
MQDWIGLLLAIAFFFALGHALNHTSQSLYWWWRDWQGEREDAKLLREQEIEEELLSADNVVKLDEIRRSRDEK